MKAKELEKLEELEVSDTVLSYFSKYETLDKAWNECNIPGWLLQLAISLEVDKRKITLAIGHCANLVRNLITDQRFINAIDTLIDFGNGKVSEEELEENRDKAAAYALYDFTINALWFIESLCEVLGEKSEAKQKIVDICKQHLTEEVLTKFKQL